MRSQSVRQPIIMAALCIALIIVTACAAPAQPAAVPPTVAPTQPTTAPSEPTAAPSQPTTAAQSIPQGGDVIMGMNAGFDSLDPHNWTGFFFATMMMSNIYDPLLTRDPLTKEIGPGLAERWEVSDDGKSITLHLKQGVKFHDGAEMTADDLDYAFKRIFDENTKPNVRTGMAAAVQDWKVIDPYTFQINLKYPSAAFFDVLTYPQLSVVCRSAVEKYGADFGQHPCGTGPFMFKEWVQDDHVTLVRNLDYNWPPPTFGRTGPAYLDSVTFQIIPEVATRQTALETGELNMLMYPDNLKVKALEADPRFEAYPVPRTGMPRVLNLPTDRWPFDDIKVRQAVAYALNRQEILDVAFSGVGKATTSLLAPGTPCYWEGAESPDVGYTFDPEKSKALLAEAGWTPGPDGILVKDGKPFKVTMVGFQIPPFTTLHQVIQAQLKNVGIDVEIVPLEQAAWLTALRQGTYNFSDNQLGPGSDPSILFQELHSSQIYPNGFNTPFYKNPEVDKLLEEATQTMNVSQICDRYKELQRIVLKEVPYVPFYAQTDYFIADAGLKGLVFDPKSLPLYYNAYIEK